LETQGERGDIGDAPEIMKQLAASWTEVRSVITLHRAVLETA
jgi:hypothetical protein